jgi:hypothetical protein
MLHLAFNRGCFEVVLMKNTLKTIGVNPYNSLCFFGQIFAIFDIVGKIYFSIK